MAPSVAETPVNTDGSNGITEKLAKASIVDSNDKKDETEQVGGDSDDEDEAAINGEGQATTGASKKKKKKKSGAAKRKAKKGGAQQTEPPTIGLSKIFLDGCYPVGEEVEYDPEKFLDE